MRLVVGCDLERLKKYYKINEYAGEFDTGEIGITEERNVTKGSSHLVV